MKNTPVKDQNGRIIIEVKEITYGFNTYYFVSYQDGEHKMIPYATKQIEEWLKINKINQ